MTLSNFSIHRPVTTAMFFIGVSLLGLISLDRLQVELMPEVVYPEIFVTISQQGMAPEQVERDLVMPVEEQVSQLLGVVEMTSTAMRCVASPSLMMAPRPNCRSIWLMAISSAFSLSVAIRHLN